MHGTALDTKNPHDGSDNKTQPHRVFSCEVKAAMLVYLNNGTVAMLAYQTNPPGIELYYHALLFRWKNKVTNHESENTLQSQKPLRIIL